MNTSRNSLFISNYGRFGPLIGAIDEGTSSVRFIVFCARSAEIITLHQIPLSGIYLQEGWMEQNPMEIMTLINECIEKCFQNLIDLEVSPSDLIAVGITNQRETSVAWDKVTGQPLHNAIVWSDIRAKSLIPKLLDKLPDKDFDKFTEICGLPLVPTFSALKYLWMLEEVEEVKNAASQNRLCFGTIDTWIIYNLTKSEKPVFVTDCTNASRTMLMNLETLNWDLELCNFFNINPEWLPKIASSSEIYGYISSGNLAGIPISGCLGDQHAALLGHMCLNPGQIKNTYGTGCFILCNAGPKKPVCQHGLITTIAFKLGKAVPAMYAIEGSIAAAGSALNWLKDSLEILDDAKSAEAIAEAVTETNDVYFVPALSGLYSPYWQQDARGVIVGITTETKSSHLIRAALEAVCFQTKDVIEAVQNKANFKIKELLVDGGMTKNNLLMQLQADLLGIPVVRPSNSEMTALGAAIAAGCAEGVDVWNFERLVQVPNKIFYPTISEAERKEKYKKWKKAVERSFHWDTGN